MDDHEKFTSLRDNNDRLLGTDTNSVFEDINVYSTVRPSPPPPLPGVFVVDPPKRQIVPQVKVSLNSSTKTHTTTYMHHHNKIGNFPGAVTSPLSQTRFNNHTTIYQNQSEFQPTSLDIFDYSLESDEKIFNRLQPILQPSGESMLPAEENIYHTLQPVPQNVYDMTPSSEAKVYQQLQPVLQNDYEFSMQKCEVPLKKSYQRVSGPPIVGNLSHKEDIKTYQKLSSSGVPNSLIRNTNSAQPHSTAASYNPPLYANSKLYQQLRQPLNKTTKINYHSSGRAFSNVEPATISSFGKAGHRHSNHLGQQAREMFAPQNKPSTFTQLQSLDNSTHFQDLIVPGVSLSNNIGSSKSQPNLQSKYSPISQDKGFQSNKPKVYLELRSPSIREQVHGNQLISQTSVVDAQHTNCNPGYNRSQVNSHQSQQMQLPFQRNENKHHLVRLPGPYEFNLSQNVSEANKLPKILCPEEYTTSPERTQHSIFNMSMESLVSSTAIQSPLKSTPSRLSGSPVKQTMTLLSLPRTPVCYGDSNVNTVADYQNTSLGYNSLSSVPSFNEILPSTNTSCSKTESRFSSKSTNLPLVPDSKLQELMIATNLVRTRTTSATKEQQNEGEKTNELKSKIEGYGLHKTHIGTNYSQTTNKKCLPQNQNNGITSPEQSSNTFSNKNNQNLNSKQTAFPTKFKIVHPQNKKNNFLESFGKLIDKGVVDFSCQAPGLIKKNNETINKTQKSFSVDIEKSVSQNENTWKLNEKNVSVEVCNTNVKKEAINQISEETPNCSTIYNQREDFQNTIKSSQEIKNNSTFDDCRNDGNSCNQPFIKRSICSQSNFEIYATESSKISEENAYKSVHNDCRSTFQEPHKKTSDCSPNLVRKCTSPLEIDLENKIENITTDRSNGNCHKNTNYPFNNTLYSSSSTDLSSASIEEISNPMVKEERNSNQITEGLIRILQEKFKRLTHTKNCNNDIPLTGNFEDLTFCDRNPEPMKEPVNGKHFTNNENNTEFNIASDSTTEIDKLNTECVSVVKVQEDFIQSHECKQDSVGKRSPSQQLKADFEVSCTENEARVSQLNQPESLNDYTSPENSKLSINSVTTTSNPEPTTSSKSPTNEDSTHSSENLVRKYKKRKYFTNNPKPYDSRELPIEHDNNHSISSKDKLPIVPKLLISLKENITSRPFNNVSRQSLGKRPVKKIDYKILNGGDDEEGDEDEIIVKKRKYHKSTKSFNHYKIKNIKATGPLTLNNDSISSKVSLDSEDVISAKPHKIEPTAPEHPGLKDEETGQRKKRKYTKRAVTTKTNEDMEWDYQDNGSAKKLKERDHFNNNAECSKYLQAETVKQEFIDPLEEGLISENEDEVVFLGFDMPPEEDETILGFDFSPSREDLEPVDFLYGQGQLQEDFVTVECDPRFLLQPAPTPCPQCAVVFTSHQDLVDHMQWHSTTQHSFPFECESCSKGFSTQAQLDKHVRCNHKGWKRFSCPICTKRFTTKAYVKKHVETIHKKERPNARFYCAECVSHFPSEKSLKRHEDKVHKKELYQCNKCLKYFEKLSNLQRHELSHSGEAVMFPCAYCSKQFSSKALLHDHWRVHKDKKKYKCEICDREFTASNSLKRHKLLHAKEKLFRCEICQRSFNYLTTLKTHLLIHTGARRFECRMCHKTFNRKDVLNAHQWIHTGEKRFNCDICNEKFRWRHAVKSHKLIYHTTEKPYVCETCGKKFSHPDSFKKHAQVHSERLHYCQICLKSFSRSNTLKIHLITHTDHKPFFCDVCKRGFRSKSHLRIHFLTHTKEKPWLCKFCNKTYKDCNQLRRHKRLVHCKAFYKKVLRNVPYKNKTVQNTEVIPDQEKSVNEDVAVQNTTDNAEESILPEENDLNDESANYSKNSILEPHIVLSEVSEANGALCLIKNVNSSESRIDESQDA